jgi:hypothetical protein
MGDFLNELHEQHKARQLRIARAAYRDLTTPPPEPEPEPEPVIEPPPPPVYVQETPRTPGHAFNIVMKEVCEYYNVREQDILSHRKMDNIARPRHIMTYLLCRLTKYTTHQIAPKMRRDPSTVFYGFKKIQQHLDDYRIDLEFLEPRLIELLPAW